MFCVGIKKDLGYIADTEMMGFFKHHRWAVVFIGRWCTFLLFFSILRRMYDFYIGFYISLNGFIDRPGLCSTTKDGPGPIYSCRKPQILHHPYSSSLDR